LQRIGGGEAVARDLPRAAIALPEDEELLVSFGALRARLAERVGARRVVRAKAQPGAISTISATLNCTLSVMALKTAS